MYLPFGNASDDDDEDEENNNDDYDDDGDGVWGSVNSDEGNDENFDCLYKHNFFNNLMLGIVDDADDDDDKKSDILAFG